MARPHRIEFAGALYHVTSRGDRREPIFEDDEERVKFLGVLAEVVNRLNWLCHAWCLIISHTKYLAVRGNGFLSISSAVQPVLSDPTPIRRSFGSDYAASS